MPVQKSTGKPLFKKLYKSRKDKMIDGVCGGLAEYLNVDPTVVRIIWAALILWGGIGLLAYLAAVILIPVNPKHASLKEDEKIHRSPYFLFGILLIVLGISLFFHEFGHFHCWRFPFFLGFGHFWKILFPSCLILAGIACMKGVFTTTAQGGRKASKATVGVSHRKRLMRSATDKKIGGVCGGLGNYFHVDSTSIRLAGVLLALANIACALVAYLLLLMFMPRED